MHLFSNTIPGTLWSGVNCLRFVLVADACSGLPANRHLDTILFHLSHGSVHVAQFLVDQFHIHILACCAHWLNGHPHISTRPGAFSPQPEVVCFFKRKLTIIGLIVACTD